MGSKDSNQLFFFVLVYFPLSSFLWFECNGIHQNSCYSVSEMAIPASFRQCFLQPLHASNCCRCLCLLPADFPSTAGYSRSTIFLSERQAGLSLCINIHILHKPLRRFPFLMVLISIYEKLVSHDIKQQIKFVKWIIIKCALICFTGV